MSAMPDKFVTDPTCKSRINPAYVDELEEFAKEMAEAVIRAAGYNESECPFCDAEGSDDCVPNCPTVKAEEFLAPSPAQSNT